MLSLSPEQNKKTGDPFRVMVVDDSAVVRGLMSRWLNEDPKIEVVASAGNGLIALSRLERAHPDVVILDVEMPEMDGMEALPRIIKAAPHVKVIMASTLTRRNAEISLLALKAGAADYVAKPQSSREVNTSLDFRTELTDKVKAFGAIAREEAQGAAGRGLARSRIAGPANDPVVPAKPLITLRKPSAEASKVMVVGSSTGGPKALFTFLEGLKGRVKVPVLITQHMPPTFTAILAEQLSRSHGIRCKEAEEGEVAEPGHFYIAPGGRHMTVEKKPGKTVIRLNDEPPENYCRPAVDQLFRSAAAAYGAGVMGVILTGMGYDGLAGGRDITKAGGTVIAQDEDTSVVWGMPGAVAKAGLASAVLPLDKVSETALEMMNGDRG